MRELLSEILSAMDRRESAACCRLVETRGSTPQKPGATMLVYATGRQSGTLGGGCVEAEVRRQAMGIMAREKAAVLRFQLDDDYGWDDGLICGGRMQVLVEPLADPALAPYLRRLQNLLTSGRKGVEAIVFDEAVAGLPQGSGYLFDERLEIVATLRTDRVGEPVPAAVREGLAPFEERPRPYARQGIAYMPLAPRCRLVIVGGGHVGQAVAQLAGQLEFDVWVVDDRQEFVTPERFPSAQRRIAGSMGDVLPELDIHASTYCLIVTRGHNHDEEALYHMAERGACYVGMIGSRRKIKLIFDDLLAEGISADALAKVHAPVGLDIGSQTVMEIAVSIVAELVAHRNKGSAAQVQMQRDQFFPAVP